MTVVCLRLYCLLKSAAHLTISASRPLMMPSASETMPWMSSSHVGTESMRPITVPHDQTLESISPVSWKLAR